MNFRSRHLLDIARELPCQIRLPGCQGGPSVAAHSNQQRHGKGTGIKAHDCFIAAACPSCHHQIDNGSKLSREERTEAWQRGHERTLVELFAGGWLQVSTKKPAR